MFDQAADLLEIKGESQFRVRAYAFRIDQARQADRGRRD
jgi:DNA polymerase/3'-5' exonuclease PolX